MNQPFDPLQANLLDLLYELRDSEVQLIIGGGYGLYLKRKLGQETNQATLCSFVLRDRPTEDLDVLLTTEILVNPAKAKIVLKAVQALECDPVPDRENFQFTRTFNYEGRAYKTKIDFLTKAPSDPSEAKRLDIQDVRVKNKGHGGIHAHLTAEAIAVEDNPRLVEIEGMRTTGETHKGNVYLPQPYAYLMMKLFAFRDWETKKKKPLFASKHALDLYSIVALMTEEELTAAEASSRKYRHTPTAVEAAGIVEEFFSRSLALGVIRFREHPIYSEEAARLRRYQGHSDAEDVLKKDVSQFVSVLADLFR